MPGRIINQAKSVFRSRTIFVARRSIERDEGADTLDVSLISSSFCASRGSLWRSASNQMRARGKLRGL